MNKKHRKEHIVGSLYQFYMNKVLCQDTNNLLALT